MRIAPAPAHAPARRGECGGAWPPEVACPAGRRARSAPDVVLRTQHDAALAVEARGNAAPLPGPRGAPARLPGAAQQGGRPRPQPPAREAAARGPRAPLAARRRHADGALPHLQVGLRAAPEVVDDLLAGDQPQVLDPVGVQAVVGDAVDVDVVDALAAALAVDEIPSKERNG